ncbi:MAG: type II toxin-antitoxin system RelE/ParE family toxin [Flavobacteriales bacterium]|nr:type II toxin-antitoxin system RelE/ParE family toxin [Flavobacteriales bacterium]
MRATYDGLKAGLGDRFIAAFDACLESLERGPKYQKRKEEYRHTLISRFPFRVVFEVEGNTVYVYQVRHTSMHPSERFGP